MTTTKRITIDAWTTQEFNDLLAQVRDEWIAVGLSTDGANRAEAERGVALAYEAAGLKPPRLIVWAGSPVAGAFVQAFMPLIVHLVDVGMAAAHNEKSATRARPGKAVYSAVRSAVRSAVGSAVDSAVDSAVRSAVDSAVRSAVGSAVDSAVGSAVDSAVDSAVYSAVDSAVGSAVDSAVDSAVGSAVGSAVYSAVYSAKETPQQVKVDLTGWYAGRMLGQHWAGYYAFYDAMERLGVEAVAPLHGQQVVARNAGWWWCFQDWAILTERPTELHRDNQGRLHNETGPAIAYPDGWGVHSWHGTTVPADLITGTWTTAQILQERNAEIRRCAIERMGWPQFIDQAGLTQVGTTVADPGNPGQTLALYDVPQQIFNARIRVLLATNAAIEADGTRHRFGLTVPETFNDPIAAAGWTFGMTAHEYQQLERAC